MHVNNYVKFKKHNNQVQTKLLINSAGKIKDGGIGKKG